MRVALVGVLAAAAEAFVVPPPGRRLAVRDAAPATDEEKVAVLLSLNARGVSWRAVEAARACVPSADVFPTASLEEARVAAEEIVRRGYGTVVSAGGDGTLSAAVSMISEARAGWGEADPLLHMPRFVALPLGTGNAVARYVLGPRYRRWRGPRGVRRALDVLSSSGGGAKNVTNDLRVPVLRVDDGDLCFIAGCGFDSFILDDYQRLRAAVRNVPVVRNVLSSVFGYFVATAIATLPQYAVGNRRMCVRVSAVDEATYVDPRRGDAALPIRLRPHAEERTIPLYEGTATIVAAGATPFYGGGMRLFPFARTAASADRVNLRVATMAPWRFVPNVLGIFGGTYRSPDLAFDFVGDDFLVEFLEDPKPVQHSGDALGRRRQFRLSVAGHVRFADLLGLPATIAHLEDHLDC